VPVESSVPSNFGKEFYTQTLNVKVLKPKSYTKARISKCKHQRAIRPRFINIVNAFLYHTQMAPL